MDTIERTLLGAFIVDAGINLVGWVIGVAFKTDKIYDALGGLSHTSLFIGSLVYAGLYNPRQILVTIMGAVWTFRLAGFLLFRVIKAGGDSRFEEAVQQPLKYLIYWVLQIVWVYAIDLPVVLANSTSRNPGFVWSDVVGPVIWGIGFLFEAVADWQKYRFKQNPQNKGLFIDEGLWRLARYPNYGGEIMVWWGMFITVSSVLVSWQWVAVVSPLVTMGLLLGLSGIPIQEQQALRRWGTNEDYIAYRKRTNLLIPVPFRFI